MDSYVGRFRSSRSLLALAMVLALALAAFRPASGETAGQQSTQTIILGAVAATAAIILYNSYHHAQVAQNTVVGHTSDGGTVYIDGRIAFPGGIVVYLSNDGRHPCNYWGDDDRCGPHARGFEWRHPDEDQWHGEGLHKGWNKGNGNPHNDNDDGEGHGHSR
jgi:hypothetical protein